MKLPVVAIVGRPNVGKSAFFNAVVRSRVSIVDDVAGVTRDRIAMEVMHDGRRFELIDTGGIGLFDEALLREEVERQIQIAIASADAILYMVDIREGVTALDQEVARRLRALEKPVLLVANKADSFNLARERHQFYGLGFGEALAISAMDGRSVREAVGAVLKLIPRQPEEDEVRGDVPRVAIVGKMNAGKSTLVNYLAREERVIVSEIPGTTRDSVDVRVELDGESFIVIDTAGVRRKKSIQDSVEFYGQARAARAIRRADVVLFLKDCTEKVTQVDRLIANAIVEQYKPCIIGVSKWDLAEDQEIEPEDYAPYLASTLAGIGFAPISFFSSIEGFNVAETFSLIPDLFRQAGERVTTSQVNRVIEEAVTRRTPGSRRSRVAKIYYGSQVSTYPPHFVLFVNDESLFDDPYRRYLTRTFREAFPMNEVPIKVTFTGKKRSNE